MTVRRIYILIACIAGTGITGQTPWAADEAFNAGSGRMAPVISGLRQQHVGTYEQFATPMGSSVSVLMADGQKIKIVSVDDTEYVNITVNEAVPEIRIGGTYRIDGELTLTSTASGAVFTVREIEYLGGGQDPLATQQYPALPDFFSVDGDATGPLTLSELRIQFPIALSRYFSDEDRECFDREVEWRAADLGDPLTMDPIRRVLLASSQAQWEAMSNADKRLQLARYVTSMALHAC